MEQGSSVKVDEQVCLNVSYFKELLKSLRKVDDNLANRINKIKGEEACFQLFQAVEKVYVERKDTIDFCSQVVDRSLKSLREQSLKEPSDAKLKSNLYYEEIKLRWVKNELEVERILKTRNNKLFKDRCHIYPNKENLE